MHDDDRALRDQLRATDPARALPPLSPTWLDRTVEQIMTDESPTTITTVVPEPTRRAFQRWIPVGGVAVGLAIGAAIVALLVLGGPEPTVETLQPPLDGGLASGSCLVLEPATVAAQEQAFAATVLQIQADTVLLEVTERFVGAVDGTITGCGVTGADSAELRAVYDAAFPG